MTGDFTISVPSGGEDLWLRRLIYLLLTEKTDAVGRLVYELTYDDAPIHRHFDKKDWPPDVEPVTSFTAG